MREAAGACFAPTFNRSVTLDAKDHCPSANAGALLLRGAHERLGLVSPLAGRLHDPRRQELIRYHLDELFRERIFALAPVLRCGRRGGPFRARSGDADAELGASR